jgi:hypothetical protein
MRRGFRLSRGRVPDRTVVPIWPPTQVTGCVAWFDMQDAASYTITAGSPQTITSLTNKVSSVAWNTAATNFPEYEAAGINSLPSLRGGVATPRGLISTEAAVVAVVAGTDLPHTIIMVTKPTAVTSTGYRQTLAWGNSGVATNRALYVGRQGATGRWRHEMIDDAALNRAATRSVDVTATAQVVTFRTTGIASSIFVNSEATPDPNAGSFNGGVITPNRAALFCVPDSVPDTFSDDRVGELLIYNRELTNYERANVEASLATKWALW